MIYDLLSAYSGITMKASTSKLKSEQVNDLTKESVREMFVGAWRLVSYESRLPNGEVRLPYGEGPKGFVIYDESGCFSLNMMKSDRDVFSADDLAGGTAEELGYAFNTFAAYSGHYEFDLKQQAIIHNIQSSLHPNLTNTAQLRFFNITETSLELVTPEVLIKGLNVRIVKWERV